VGEGAQVGLTVADSDIHVFASGDADSPRLDANDTLEVAQ
jgi:multiple sugar transport system ATP-binding protein